MADLTNRLLFDIRPALQAVDRVADRIEDYSDIIEEAFRDADVEVDLDGLLDDISRVQRNLTAALEVEADADLSELQDANELAERLMRNLDIPDPQIDPQVDDSEIQALARTVDDVDQQVQIDVEVDDSGVDGLISKITSFARSGAAAAGVAIGAAITAGIGSALETEAVNDRLAGQLGLTEAEAERAGEAVDRLFSQGAGESAGEVADAFAAANQQLEEFGELAEFEIDSILSSQLAVAKAFEVDVGESARSAGQLIRSGLADNATEAFDIITEGLQNVNQSDDFLDTVNEYATVFADLGLEADQVLSLLQSGLSAGAFNTDFVADAFKEFGIRAREGGDDVAEAFASIGLNYQGFLDDFSNADGTFGDGAIQTILQELQALEDPILRNEAAVALFGTKAEDLGPVVFDSLSLVNEQFEDLSGSSEELAEVVNDNLATTFEAFRRTALLRIRDAVETFVLPALERLIGFGERARQFLQPVFSEIAGGVTAFATRWRLADGDVTSSGFPGFMERLANFILFNVLPAVESLAGFVSNDLAPVLEAIGGTLLDTLGSIDFGALLSGVGETIGPLIEGIRVAFDNFVAALPAYQEAVLRIFEAVRGFIEGLNFEPVLTALQAAFTSVGDAISQIDFAAIFSNIASVFEVFIGIVQPVAQFLLDVLGPAISGLGEVVAGVIGVIANLIEGDWSGVWESFQQIASGAFDIVKALPAELAGLIADGFSRATEFLSSVDWTDVGATIGGTLLAGLEAAFGAAGDLGVAFINAIIGAINFGINQINDAIPNEIDIPGPFGSIDLPDNPLPNIPNLAFGEYFPAIAGGHLARVAENRHGEVYMNEGAPFSRNMSLLGKFDNGRFLRRLLRGGGDTINLNLSPPTDSPDVWMRVAMAAVRKNQKG